MGKNVQELYDVRMTLDQSESLNFSFGHSHRRQVVLAELLDGYFLFVRLSHCLQDYSVSALGDEPEYIVVFHLLSLFSFVF